MKEKEHEKKSIVAFFLAVLLTFTLSLLGANAVHAEDTVYVDRSADVVFVIDGTGSMQPYITSVKTNLTNFIQLIDGEGINVRIKFVVYRDITCGETTETSEWYDTADAAIEYLDAISADGGGDRAETTLDGLGQLFKSGFGFRSDGIKFCIALTDADAKIDNTMGYTCEEEVIQELRDNAINTSFITHTDFFDDYECFVTEDGGILADIQGDYSILLKDLAISVIDGVANMVVHEIYPTEGLVATAQTVDVKATGVNFDENFRVTIGGEDVSALKETSDGFSFQTPTDLALGSYDIVVKNGTDAENKTIGQYTYVATPVEVGYKVKSIKPATGLIGEAVTVKVTVDKITYADDFSVTVGGEPATIQKKAEGYFTFTVPTTLNVGTYNIVVTNGKEKKIGKYVVTKLQPLAITGLDRESVLVGTSTWVKAYITFPDGVTYTNFKVLVGGVEVATDRLTSTYFKFQMPADLAIGTYDVVAVNGGTETNAVDITVKEEDPLPPITITSLEKDSVTEGTATWVKAYVEIPDGVTYTDFKVLVGDVEVATDRLTSTYFKFQMPKDFAAGSYEVVAVNGGSESNKVPIEVAPVTKPVLEPITITSLEKDSVTEGTAIWVKAYVEIPDGVTYTDFKVLVGDVEVATDRLTSTYFKFQMPADLAIGTYDVVAVNGGSESNKVPIEVASVTKPVLEPITITSLEKDSVTKGTATWVKAYVEIPDGVTYTDFKVLVGDVEVATDRLTSTYFKFQMPADLAIGTYDVVAVNGGSESNKVSIEVKGKPDPGPIVIIRLEKDSFTQGTAAWVKAYVTIPDGVTYDNLTVKIDGTETRTDKLVSTYFKFYVPSGLTVGEHTVVITNAGVELAPVKITITEIPPDPKITITGLEKTSAKAGSTAMIKVYVTNASYQKDFTVTVGGKTAKTDRLSSKYFKFQPPTDLPAGTYEIEVTNNGVTISAGTITLK